MVGLVVDVADSVDISKLTPGKRVTLLSDSYRLEKMLPSSVRYSTFSRVQETNIYRSIPSFPS